MKIKVSLWNSWKHQWRFAKIQSWVFATCQRWHRNRKFLNSWSRVSLERDHTEGRKSFGKLGNQDARPQFRGKETEVWRGPTRHVWSFSETIYGKGEIQPDFEFFFHGSESAGNCSFSFERFEFQTRIFSSFPHGKALWMWEMNLVHTPNINAEFVCKEGEGVEHIHPFPSGDKERQVQIFTALAIKTISHKNGAENKKDLWCNFKERLCKTASVHGQCKPEKRSIQWSQANVKYII